MKRPCLVIAEGFVLGEVLALLTIGWQIAAACIVAVTAIVITVIYKTGRPKKRVLPVFFILLFTIALSAGFLRSSAEKMKLQKKEAIYHELLEGKQIQIEGVVKDLKISEKKQTIKMKAMGAYSDRILVYTNQKTTKESDVELKIGQKIRIYGKLELFEEAGNIGQFDYRQYYKTNGYLYRIFANRLEIVDQNSSPLLHGLHKVRGKLETALNEISEEKDFGLFKAIVLGDKSDIADGVYEEYQKMGIAHLLAVSGIHVSFLGLGLYKILRRAGTGYTFAGIFSMMMLICYGFITGSTTSVIRAVCMIMFAIIADEIGRTYDMISAMSFSMLVILLSSPMQILNSGFELSFGAIIGIGGLYPLLEKKTKSKYLKMVLASVSIHIVTIPVILFHYYQLPTYAMAVNFVAVPLMAMVLVSVILAVFAELVIRWLIVSSSLLGPAHYILQFYQLICEYVEKIPFNTIIFGRPKLWQIVLYAGFEIMVVAIASKRNVVHTRTIVLMLAGVLLLYRLPGHHVKVTFLDVGQGDGICIEYKNYHILIDGGSTSEKDLGKAVLEPFLKSSGISKIDYAFISHPDEDHISGIKYMMENETGVTIQKLIMPKVCKNEKGCVQLKEIAQEEKIQVMWMEKNNKITLEDLEFYCISPGAAANDMNDNSLVLFMKYKNHSVLFTGDISSSAEQTILKEYNSIPAEVLKIAHHGAKTSTGREWLEAVHPQIAVVSYGIGNRYGHPSKETLERLKDQNVNLYQTGEMGAVILQFDQDKIKIFSKTGQMIDKP